jgi:membrane protease YdiL (CAAX protease family)
LAVASIAIYAAAPAKGWRPWGLLVPFLGILFVVLTGLPFELLMARLHLVDAIRDDPVGLTGFLAFLIGPFSALALAVLAWVRFVERRPFSTIGLTTPGGAAFARGLLGGLLLMGALIAGIWLAGGLTAGAVAPAFASLASLASIALLLLAFIVQSSAEELLFRGWMLSALGAKFGTVAAVIVSSLVFMLLHFERHAPLLFFLNTFLFASFACSWSLRTGNIWGVMGWHSTWNWLLGTGFGVLVTGLDTHMPALLIKLTPVGPVWLTGGAQGSEGSVVCTVIFVCGIAWNIWRKRARARVATPFVHT